MKYKAQEMMRGKFSKLFPIGLRFIELVYESSAKTKKRRELKSLLRYRGALVVFAFCFLLFASQTRLPPEIVDGELPALSLELDVGSPAEASADGTFYWVTQTDSTFVLANNTASPTNATLKGILSVSPCSHEVALKIEADGLKLLGEIGPLETDYRIDLPASLRPYERRVVKLNLNGIGCPTAPSDGRVIISKLTGLALVN
jgi:hypothetical protein